MRLQRWSLIATALCATLVAIGALLFAFLQTGAGDDFIAGIVHDATGGEVTLKGLHGALPCAPRATALELRDSKGVWLTARNVSVEWSPFAYLLHDRVQVARATADSVAIIRRPLEKKSTGTTPAIDIGALSVSRLDVGPALAGTPIALAVDGAVHYISHGHIRARLTARRLNGAGIYAVDGALDDGTALGSLDIHEPRQGLIGGLLGLPTLGDLAIRLRAGGTAKANVVAGTLAAGPLRADGTGTLDLPDESAAIDFRASAPAMQPAADLRWTKLAVEGHFAGRFDTPQVTAQLRIDNLSAAGSALAHLTAQATGAGGRVQLAGEADGVRLPGPQAGLFAASPFTFTAETDLHDARRPLAFTLAHRLLHVAGQASLGATPNGMARIDIPAIAPLAPTLGVDGKASLDIRVAAANNLVHLAAQGRMSVAGQNSMTARLIGRDAKLSLKADVQGADVHGAEAELTTEGAHARITGSLDQGRADARWTLALADLKRVVPTLEGNIALDGTIRGPVTAARLAATGQGDIATKGFARERVTLTFESTNPAALDSATLQLKGRFDAAPVSLDATLARKGSVRNIHLAGGWKSLKAKGDVVVPDRGAPGGTVALALANLGDVATIVDQPLSGSAILNARFASAGGHARASVSATIRSLTLGAFKAGTIAVTGDVDDWTSMPAPSLKLTASGLAAEGFAGDAQATAVGPAKAIALTLRSTLKDDTGAPAQLAASAVLDGTAKRLRLTRFDASGYRQTLALSAPATIDLANGVAVDHVAARLDQGSVQIAGRFLPSLDAHLSVHGLPAGALDPWLEGETAQGTLSAEAQLAGSPSAPEGTIALTGHALSVRGISTHAIAPAELEAHATLANRSARVTASLASGGASQLSLDGTLGFGGALDLHASGHGDLAMLDPLLTPDGRSVHGRIALDLALGGTLASPQVGGVATLSNGEVQDFARGLRVSAIAATFTGNGNALVLDNFSGHAGKGTVGASGRIDLGAPGMPLDMTITLKNAQPATTDLFRATLDGTLLLKGSTNTALALSGQVKIDRGEIDIPERLPHDVVVIPVRRKSQPPPPPPAAPLPIAFDVTLSSPGQLFVRGRGLDAEVEGQVHLGGTADARVASGEFDLRRGTLSLAGQTLDITTGKVTFTGAGVTNRLDPTLDFIAQTSSANVLATLEITGFASKPQIQLSSTPPLPQDEVLARLLFQQSTTQLSPVQMAEIGAALASLGGIGSGLDPVAAIRRSLGLDRLAIGSVQSATSTQTQTTVEAGKYVTRNVYIGARQNLSGGTQAQVQYDITKHLKAQAMLGTGTTATVTQGSQLEDNGSGVGLSYQFEY